MSRCESKSQYDKGATLEKDGKRYAFVTGENLVPNSNFSYNLAGWYRGNTAGEGPKANKKYFRADNRDGTGSGSDLYRAWKVKKGKTYFFTSRFQNDCGWARLSKGDDISVAANSAECDDNGKYTVVLEAIGEKTKINMNYRNEYIRINNNNKQIKVATSLTDNGDGTYTLTFDTNSIGTKAN